MAIETTVKKWGNSFGVVLPKELVKKEHLKENQKIVINIVKEADLSGVFGLLKGKLRKFSGQELKDMAREGWD